MIGDAASEQLQQQAYYRDTANVYDDWHTKDRDEHTFALEHILFYLRWCGAETVLDSGCGTGRTLRFLLERAPDLRLRGNDPSAGLLTVATERFGISEDILDCVGSEHLPYPDASFDAIIATGVLHHVPDPNRVVNEFLRVARRAVFLSDTNMYGSGSLSARITKVMLRRIGLLRGCNWIRRGGQHWYFTKGDGVAYSYSALDALPLLDRHCRQIVVLPTAGRLYPAGVPLLGSSHVLVCGFKESLP